MKRKSIISVNYLKLVLLSLFVGLVSSILAFALKHLTEFFEHKLFESVRRNYSFLFIFLPTVGITAIYFLRKYAFRNRKNKGITEIYKTLDQRKDHLPLYKISSHFINGFLTVVFGGSTGVEVSTVVATAAVGNYAYQKDFSAKAYKRELICAGVTAGVAILFSSPLAGLLFAIEVIARKVSKPLAIACCTSALVSWLFIFLFDNQFLLSNTVVGWNLHALPFFIILSLLGGLLAVYFTLLVTRMKRLFSNISNNFLRVNLGALLVGLIIYFFPSLYGDSYHGLRELLNTPVVQTNAVLIFFFVISLLKPLVASLTLGAGGDGGVFAPSIVAGAFLGLFVAFVGNNYFNAGLIPLNFALVGAAATLSGSLFAPFTSLILICSLPPHGFVLFVPILIGSSIAYIFSKKLLPYNAYSYDLIVHGVS